MNQSSIDYFLKKYNPEPKKGKKQHVSFDFSSNIPQKSTTSEKKSNLRILKNSQQIERNSEISPTNKDKSSQDPKEKNIELGVQVKYLEKNNLYLTTKVRFYEEEVKKLNKDMETERLTWKKSLNDLKSQLESLKNRNPIQVTRDSADIYQISSLKQLINELKIKENRMIEDMRKVAEEFDKERTELLLKISTQEQQYQNTIKTITEDFQKVLEINNTLRLKCEKSNWPNENPENLNYKKNSQKSNPFNTHSVDKTDPSANLKSSFSYLENRRHPKKSPSVPNFSLSSFLKSDFGRKEIFVGDGKNPENFLKHEVKKLESEISDITKDYKSLLNSAQPCTENYFLVKKEINRITKLLEAKTKSLFDTKRKYSNLIRSYSVSAIYSKQ